MENYPLRFPSQQPSASFSTPCLSLLPADMIGDIQVFDTLQGGNSAGFLGSKDEVEVPTSQGYGAYQLMESFAGSGNEEKPSKKKEKKKLLQMHASRLLREEAGSTPVKG
ncbi:hypothetical protein C4D60_Mb06t07440 [Musa balbisiana]|uniref:Uncharacterized protein n=1 Tax=Musa balbisiana TaxID=52838 RepID=A0A4S8ILB7_MUSBA|nr:hypothetical protein C4D60_Mb06t07440 [Musa balbisiana]